MSAGPASVLGAVRRTGLLDPLALSALGWSTALWGPTLAAAYGAASVRYPNRIAIVDDHGALTYRQLDQRAGAVAGGLRRLGLDRGDSVGILCRNHRGFVEANLAATKLGCRPVLLNVGLPAVQLAEVVRRESVTTVLADTDLADGLPVDGVSCVVAATEHTSPHSFPGLPAGRPVLPRLRLGDAVPAPTILTSGTTGAPRGALRSLDPSALVGALGFLEAIPYTRGDVFVLPAPLFHAWGFSQLALAATLAATVVLRHRFDPEQVLADIEVHGATALVAVPVMLQRILVADEDAEAAGTIDPARDLSSLRIVATSGSPLPGDLAIRWMDRFGDTLHNLYGSTECGQVSVAGPADLRADTRTAGQPLRGVEVRLLDPDGTEVAPGEIGEIMVGGGAPFDGYTDGTNRRRVGELLATGDRGRFDEQGRLTVLGRADDLIISGGENVYPSNVERAFLGHEAVEAVAVVGVDDDDLGQRIRAVVVTRGPEAVVDRGTASAMTRRLKAHAKTLLASHEVPRELVYVSDLPRNQAGKILRTQLQGSRRSVPFQARPTRTVSEGASA